MILAAIFDACKARSAMAITYTDEPKSPPPPNSARWNKGKLREKEPRKAKRCEISTHGQTPRGRQGSHDEAPDIWGRERKEPPTTTRSKNQSSSSKDKDDKGLIYIRKVWKEN